MSLLSRTVHGFIKRKIGSRNSSFSDTVDVVSSEKTPTTRELESLRPGKEYTLDQVADHCHAESLWIVVQDVVYDVTDFLAQHPGGMDIIFEHAGRDATWAFISKGHSSHAFASLSCYKIGVLVEEERSCQMWNELCGK